MIERKLIKLSLIEDRCAEGWPRALHFEFSNGFPLTARLAEQSEYSQVARAVEAVNASLAEIKKD